MGRSPGASFRFEKNRLLHRSQSIELWDGWLDGQAHVIKRYLKPRTTHWNEYALLARIKNSILLKPSCAGHARDGSFCYAMPVDFTPVRKQEFRDLPAFSILLLSLICALHKKKIDVQWNPNHIVFDARTGKTFLAGMHPLKDRQINPNDLRHLMLLHGFASKHFPANHELLKLLRKWTRRKEGQLAGCLQDLFSCFPFQIDKTIFVYEWPYTRELELVAGLFRLAEQGKGRTLIIQGEPGEGRSSLLKQIHSDLLLRNSNTIYFSPPKEERTFHSAKSLFRMFQQTKRGAQPLPRELNETNLITYFMKMFEESSVVTNILIDNFQNCDVFSKRFLLRLFQQAANLKLFFLVSCDSAVPEVADFAVTLSLHKPALKQLQESFVVPFWQEKQRRNYFEQIYQRTAGNPLFFAEYLSEALSSRQCEMKWNDGEWSFAQGSVPDFPVAMLDFYWNSAPELSEAEMEFLEIASVKSDEFEAADQDRQVVESLVQKNVLVQVDGKYRFRKQLFSTAIKKRLDPERLRRIHKTLADAISLQAQPDSLIMLARHYLKAGEPSAALQWTCRAIEKLGYSIEPSALMILMDLEAHEKSLTSAQKILLFRSQGDVYYRRGKFPHAAASYRKAMDIPVEDPVLRFTLGLLLAECLILQEDIVSAQQALSSLDPLLNSMKEESILFRYFIARGVCSHYRGPRNPEDLQTAFSYAESLADDALLAHGYRRCAWLSLKEGQLSEASKLARRALRHAKIARDTEEIGHCYKIFASIAWRKSKHDQAEKMMKRSIHSFQKTQNEFGCAGVWNLLGNVYLEKYRFSDSARSFEKAVTLFGHLDHPREVSLAQFNMGLVFLEQGRLKDAEKIFIRCRAIDRSSGNKWFYAYDLRALAVYCILQGYARKATRLLKRTIEICEELKAEGDILQTRMILLFHHLDQGNYRDAQSLVPFLEQRVDELREPLTEAEIHHLLAYYYGFLNETSKANVHLKKSLSIGARIRHYKLVGKNLILGLIFRGVVPRQDDPDLLKAISNFRKSKNNLEFADYLLKFYQAFPVLVKDKLHLKRIHWMENLYRNLHIRPRFQAVRKLLRSHPKDSADPVYDWWHALLGMMSAPQELQSKLQAVLKELSNEFHSSYSQIQYLSSSGIFERVLYSDTPVTNTVEELPGKIFEQALLRRESLCLDARSELELSRNPWVILNEVRSILAVPFFRSDQLLGLWYFERRRTAPVFSSKDLQKASFFSMACSPLLEKAMERESARETRRIPATHRFEDVIGVSESIQEVGRLVVKVSPLDVSVLIVGESGTGKELVARNIHRLSKRSAGPFVALNCSAIPETLIESELFGHTRGAFTGAVAAKPGSVERAHKGTLFLDEVGDLSMAAQAKLLRVVQEREVQRLGETAVRKIDVRFLFATHKNIERMVKDGAYREDLFYRISGYLLTVPPLRERKQDIPMLVRHFTEKYSSAFGKEAVNFSSAAMKVMCDYSWPGNIREMENLVQTVLVNSDSADTVEVEDLPRSLKTHRIVEKTDGLSLEEGRELFDRDFVLQALVRNQWNKSQTAKELKITRQGLINMIQRLRLEKK